MRDDARHRSYSDERRDEQLVDAINRGDQAAFEQLYLRYRDWVVALAYRFTGDRELALDVLQDVFVYFVRRFPGFELRGKVKTFLYPAVRHTAIAIQSRSRRMRSMTEVGDPSDASTVFDAGATEDRERLAEAVASLPAAQREAVLLRFGDGLSIEEIATAVEAPIGTVKSRLHHALATLRDDPRARDAIRE
ncbi:MAG: sigma-70 family RNA polymerase sigma factor [Phycisphaerales bacterium]|nr:MAG: sigma-70 family RNA polymerase sigma factor [Phycisphaerales bacterium]